ncbi:unnamed protein product [Lota lota]
MQHPWIQEHFQSPSSSPEAAPQQSTNGEHMVDSTSSTAQSTFRAGPRPVGTRGRTREGALDDRDALSAFRKHLTPFEQREIKQYKEVLYLGIAAEKVQETFTCNYGQNDIQGHYNMVIKDHITFRYEVLQVMGQRTFGYKYRDHKVKQLVAMKVRSHAISLLQCLQFLSRTSIIHCDLKPNILISKEDSKVIKVADFGASRLDVLSGGVRNRHGLVHQRVLRLHLLALIELATIDHSTKRSWAWDGKKSLEPQHPWVQILTSSVIIKIYY